MKIQGFPLRISIPEETVSFKYHYLFAHLLFTQIYLFFKEYKPWRSQVYLTFYRFVINLKNAKFLLYFSHTTEDQKLLKTGLFSEKVLERTNETISFVVKIKPNCFSANVLTSQIQPSCSQFSFDALGLGSQSNFSLLLIPSVHLNEYDFPSSSWSPCMRVTYKC